MSAFWACVRNEWSKLLKRKKYMVFLFIGLVICLLWAMIGRFASDLIQRSSGLFISLTPAPMGVLPFFLQLLIPFLMFMGLTDLITVEGAENTMKSALVRPVERWKLYTAKITAVVSYAALYLGSVFALTVALQLIFGDKTTAGAVFIALGSYALTLIPLAILACFAALVALLGRSGTLTMFILLLCYLAFSVLPVIFPVLTEMVFTSYLGWYKLWIGALPAAGKLVHMLLIVFGYGAVFFTAGSLVFDRKEY